MRLQFKLLPLIWFIQTTTINQCWCVICFWSGVGWLCCWDVANTAWTFSVCFSRQRTKNPSTSDPQTNQIQHKCKSLGGTDTHSLREPEETQPRAVSNGWNAWKQWPTDAEWPAGSLPPGLNAGFATKFQMSTSTATSSPQKQKKTNKKCNFTFVFLISPHPVYSNSQWKTRQKCLGLTLCTHQDVPVTPAVVTTAFK